MTAEQGCHIAASRIHAHNHPEVIKGARPIDTAIGTAIRQIMTQPVRSVDHPSAVEYIRMESRRNLVRCHVDRIASVRISNIELRMWAIVGRNPMQPRLAKRLATRCKHDPAVG